MTDMSSMPTYESIVTGAMPTHLDANGDQLIAMMYRASLDAIAAGTAIYRETRSAHGTLLNDASNAMAHGCFVPRKGKLPPRETWLALTSTVQHDDQELLVIDHLKLLLPKGSLGDQIDVAVSALAYLGERHEHVVYPHLHTEKVLGSSLIDYTISKSAVRKLSKGLLSVTQRKQTYAFHRI